MADHAGAERALFSVLDAVRLVAAVAACGLVIALPGAALARAFGLPRQNAVVVGLALLPLLDSLAVRWLGIDVALAATLALAVCGLVACRDAGGRWPSLSREAAALCLVWLAILVFEWVDLDVAGRLYQPFIVVDGVKHAATAQAILDSGAPPHDPFFLRPERVGYYYFFYTPVALAQRLGADWLDARAAVGGAAFWVGIGLYGLVRLALERAGLAIEGRRTRLLVVALLAAGGLDIVAVLRIGLLQGTWLAEPVVWTEQVTGWFESLIWVPHHVTGMIAGMLGLIALASPSLRAAGEATQGPRGEVHQDGRPRRLGRLGEIAMTDTSRRVVLAGLCFASAFGASLWLTLVLVATVALWLVALAVERDWRTIGTIALAGALALVLAAPQLHDLVVGRAPTGAAPIVPTVRAFPPVDALVGPGPWRYLARLVALPLNYFAAFGILASGALLFWRQRAGAPRGPEFGRVLALAAIAGLALGAFFKSTLFNNDLGWRVVEFPLLAGTVWTIAALQRMPTRPSGWPRVPAFLMLLLGLGWATNAYAFLSLRAYPWMPTDPSDAFVAADPRTEHALRVAYAWADRNLPPRAVLQHDPTRPRAFAFALYGRHQVAVADSFGSLFGANPAKVDARIAALAPIYAVPLPAADVLARARAAGVDDLVVTAADPVWWRPDATLMRAAPAYASARVRIVPVASLAAAPARPIVAEQTR